MAIHTRSLERIQLESDFLSLLVHLPESAGRVLSISLGRNGADEDAEIDSSSDPSFVRVRFSYALTDFKEWQEASQAPRVLIDSPSLFTFSDPPDIKGICIQILIHGKRGSSVYPLIAYSISSRASA